MRRIKDVKKALRNNGHEVTREVNNTVKAASEQVVKQTARGAENVTNAAASPKKDEIKAKTNLW